MKICYIPVYEMMIRDATQNCVNETCQSEDASHGRTSY